MKQRLIFCRTPLQSLVVQAIQRTHPAVDTIVYQPTSGGTNHRYYFELMQADSKYFVKWLEGSRSGFVRELQSYWQIPRRVRRHRFDEYLISSIDSLPFALLTRGRKVTISLFDDGMFNLLESEVYPRLRHEHKLYKWTKRLLGALDNADMAGGLERHYTFFPQEHALFRARQVVPVPLFEERRSGAAAKGPVRILLGTYLPGFAGGVSTEAARTYERVIGSPGFDLFLPHPIDDRPIRVSPRLAELAWVADTARERVAEHVVLDLIERGYEVSVFGFASTALVTLAPSAPTTNIVVPGLADDEAPVFEKLGVRNVRVAEVEALTA